MLHGVIEGIAIDLVLVRFTHIDPSDLDREFSFVIDTSNRIYKGEAQQKNSLHESSRTLSSNEHTILTNSPHPG